jgi:integrase
MDSSLFNVAHDAPLRLADAAKIAFPAGGMTASGLRREAARGRLTDINGALCRAYAVHRGSEQAARRELEDLRAAINHHRREGLCNVVVDIVLPPKAQPRQRWLTRSEAARLIWAAWRYHQPQGGVPTDRHMRRHVARFILVGLYTGTRGGAICAASFTPAIGRGHVDLENGVFHRLPQGQRETNKRQPTIRLPRRLLAHLRRWRDKGISKSAVVEFDSRPVASVKKAFANVARDAGLEGVTPHVLRHTAVTWAMQGGADRYEAAGFFGLGMKMLESVYGHHHPDHQKGVGEALTRGNKRGP